MFKINNTPTPQPIFQIIGMEDFSLVVDPIRHTDLAIAIRYAVLKYGTGNFVINSPTAK